MEGMPEIIDINGTAKIENSKVKFDINGGSSNGLNITSGSVDLYDLDTDNEKAKINLDIQSENSYVTDYLKQTEIEQDNYSKLQDIAGDVNLNLKLEKEFNDQNNFQTNTRGIKVRGSFQSMQEAELRCKLLREVDPNHDVYIGQVGVWMPFHPEAYKTGKVEYLEKELKF